MPNEQPSPGQLAAVAAALDLVPEGSVIGLGSGKAAMNFVRGLGARVAKGFRVTGVPTSNDTAALAQQLNIPLTTLEQVERLVLTVDGADEVDPNLELIKGLGGALTREKIVAASSDALIILAGEEKLVNKLGDRNVLPVDIVPYGLTLCTRRLAALCCPPKLRERNGKPFLTDNGSYVLDCQIGPIDDPAKREREILAIPGVVGVGLFVGMAKTALIYGKADFKRMDRGSRP